MFSVDNFYDFMKSSYGHPRKDILLYKHLQNGSKNIHEIWPYTEQKAPEGYHRVICSLLHGGMVLHDQEPFMKDYLDTYRAHRIEKNNWRESWLNLPDHILLLEHLANGCTWPIFCHSEKNSDDIQWLEDHGFIGCHYLWHGLIARDWYRHWKHHPDLQNINADWQKRFLLYARGKDGTRSYRQQLLQDLECIKDAIHHDWKEENSVPASHSAIIDINDAKHTAIHIVAETVFDLGKIHATEKVFKPIVMRQPFLIFAGAGMLQYLRDYGFKTFDSVWDESYDLEKDHRKRFQKLISLIKHLNSLDQDQFQRLMIDCQQILDHNRRHFYSDDFESIMMRELKQNVEIAIEKQQRLTVSDPGGSLFYVADYLINHKIEVFPALQQLMDHLCKTGNTDRVEKIKRQYPWFGQ